MVASGAHTSPLANQKLIGADVLVAQLGVSHSEPKPMFTLDQVVPWGRSFDTPAQIRQADHYLSAWGKSQALVYGSGGRDRGYAWWGGRDIAQQVVR